MQLSMLGHKNLWAVFKELFGLDPELLGLAKLRNRTTLSIHETEEWKVRLWCAYGPINYNPHITFSCHNLETRKTKEQGGCKDMEWSHTR